MLARLFATFAIVGLTSFWLVNTARSGSALEGIAALVCWGSIIGAIGCALVAVWTVGQ